MGYSGDEIYQKVVAQKTGTQGLIESKDHVFDLVQRYKELSEKIKGAAQEMEQYWKGDAAGAAQRGFGPAAVSYSTMGENLNKAQDLTRAQAQTFDEVHPKIKPIPSVPAEPSGMSNFMSYIPGLSQMTGSGDEVENYDNAMAAKQEAEANNIRHYSHLATSTDYNVGNMPAQYGPQQAEHGNMSVGGGPGGSGHGGGESGGGSGGHTGAPMSAGPANAGGGAGSVGAGGVSSGSTAAPHLGSGSPSGSGAAGGSQPSHAGGDAMPPSSSVPSTPAATANSNYAPPTPVDGPNTGIGGGYASGGSAGGGSGAGYGGLGGGFVGGFGGSGGTSGASPRLGGGRSGAGFEDGARGGTGAKGGAESGPKSGARSGAGAGRMAEESTAGASRGAAGASGSGRTGMPMGGGAGAGKKDDKEHETASYLVTQDNGNEIVGDLPATVPPVIGGDLEPPRPEQG